MAAELYVDERDGLNYAVLLDGMWWCVPPAAGVWQGARGRNQHSVRPRAPVVEGHRVPDALAAPLLRYFGVDE